MLLDIIQIDGDYLIIPYRYYIIKPFRRIFEEQSLFYEPQEIYAADPTGGNLQQKNAKIINYLKSLEYNVYFGNLEEKHFIGTSKKNNNDIEIGRECDYITIWSQTPGKQYIYLELGIMNIYKLKLLYM